MLEDSRLERFLKALCSLDYSDLPTPLSRVEVLWNCLITGEATPDFQPQSRTEKYLMTILGVYDLEDIPKPISRAETLLYKLATGDTDVELEDCVKSRYERLLSEIVANGGVGDNVDFEYVTYVLSESFNTLYNTDEAPVKSAILKGQTLVNISPLNGEITLTPASVQHIDSPFIKSNTTFTISFNCSSVPTTGFIEFRQIFENTALKMENKPVVQGYNQFKVTTVSSEINRFRFKNDSTSETDLTFNNLMIIEGDYTNVDIPFFEGMKSVQMPVLKTTGKNLFDGELISGYYEDGSLSKIIGSTSNLYKTIRINLKKGTYTFSFEESVKFVRQLKDGVYDTFGGVFTKFKTTLQIDGTYILSFRKTDNSDFDLTKIQIEQGSTATSYEPFKSNILTVNEDITLRSNGDVYDELNLLTGRLTQRIDENNEVLAQEVVKTVDLSILDQDGNKTKLKTFDDITHVSLSSEGLIPEAEMTVVTKNLDDISQASTMSLRMNDISDRQNELQNEVVTQSESIDSTMMATTEIYEQTL